MTKIRVTKKIYFEMAHALYNYNGLCRNIHGHSYKLHVTVMGTPLQSDNNSSDGMVIDFSNFKKIITQHIVDVYDHSLMLNKKEDSKIFNNKFEFTQRLHVTDFQPTCENIIIHFVEILKKHLPSEISLYSIKLHETENSFAEWYAKDQ